MIHRSNLGVFQPADFQIGTTPWNPIRGGVGAFVHADLSDEPLLPGAAGISGLGCSCQGCSRGMGSISTDFTAMLDGSAPWSTYAMYGAFAIGGIFVLSAFMQSGGSGRRRR